MTNPLESYINCARLVFNVEPADLGEDWDDFDEFEEKLIEFYTSLLCKNCNQLLNDPCTPKKQHFSCQHRVCLDCIGKNRATITNCKMCRDFTLFEKSNPTKLVLGLFQELCELIKGSWIYEYIQRRTNHDTGQSKVLNLTEIIESGVNYGRSSGNVSIIVEDSSSPAASSSDENSNSSITVKTHQQESVAKTTISQTVPYNNPQAFRSLSPLPVSPKSTYVQSPEQFSVLPPEPVIQATPPLPLVPTPPLLPPPPPQPQPAQSLNASQQISVQYAPSTPIVVQSPLPSTSRLTTPSNAQILKTNPSSSALSFISHPQMHVKSLTPSVPPMTTKSIMSPMKIQQQQQQQQQPAAPTIYSVMYTGSGNKITLKRKTPDETNSSMSELKNSSNNTNLLKTDSTNSTNFKSPPVQVASSKQPQSQQIPIVVPTTNTPNLMNASAMSAVAQNANPNEPLKRRGCRCGNATAAPGKLTCCGQRCPCYVDSKACIDCKCRGCRNPHFIDGHKKMRHQVPDLQTQQQQQQSFLASIQQHQQHSALLKDPHKSTAVATNIIKNEDLALVEPAIITKGQNSINNCIISMNSNGQYQIKPRIIMKEQVKATMSPLIFPTTSAGIVNTANSGIQIVGLYSQVPMTNDKKIIIKSEPSTPTVMSFPDTTNNLNTSML